MVKIITPGVTNKYTNTCPHCMCVYEYEAADVIHGWDYMAVPYIMCPYCGKRNNVNYIPYNPVHPNDYTITCEQHQCKGERCQNGED